jgi:hypothetical protein
MAKSNRTPRTNLRELTKYRRRVVCAQVDQLQRVPAWILTLILIGRWQRLARSTVTSKPPRRPARPL